MNNTYVIPGYRKENVLKKLSRLQKKAACYGQNLNVKCSDSYAKEVSVYETIEAEYGLMVRKKTGTMLIEAFDLTIESDIVRNGAYFIVARIEHLKGGNIVSTMEDNRAEAWSYIEPHCEHCGGRHGQKITFIVRNEDGHEKQVGRTCLKDYCGINPQIIGIMNQIHDLMLNETCDNRDVTSLRPAIAYRTIDVIALAIRIYNNFGYVSSVDIGSNRDKLRELIAKNEKPTASELSRAEDISEKIAALEHEEAFRYNLDNIRSLIRSRYCTNKHYGYLAYAPLAYECYLKTIKREQERKVAQDKERRRSDFVGEIGQRIIVNVSEMKLLTSWEGEWGRTYLYKIVDTGGNVLIWYASHATKAASRLKVTIKNHSERDGVKQTIVTRCTAVA